MLIIERTTQIKKDEKSSPRCIRRCSIAALGAALKVFDGSLIVRRSAILHNGNSRKLHAKRTRVVVLKLFGIWRSLSEVTRPERPHTKSPCEFSSSNDFSGKSVYCAISSPRTASIEPAGLSRATRRKRQQSSLSRNCDSVSSAEVEVFCDFSRRSAVSSENAV